MALSVWVQILPGANLSGLEFCTRVHFDDSWESFHKYSTGSRVHFDVSGITVFFLVEASVATRRISHIGPITMSGTLIGLFVTVALPSRKKTAPLIFVSDRRDVMGLRSRS